MTARELFSQFTLRPVTRSDWPWISRWFTDERLDRELGPVDLDWFDHVLDDSAGVHLVVEADLRPVALAGCAWDPDGIGHALTDLAVDPSRRGSSIGRRALSAVLAWAGHPPARGWVAFVDPDNKAAFGFFTAIGWCHDGIDDGMHRFSRMNSSDRAVTAPRTAP